MESEVCFAGIKFRGISKDHIFKNLNEWQQIITVNSEFIVKANSDEKFRKLINNNIATFDGQVPCILAKIVNRTNRIEKISGSDFIFDVCEYAAKKDLSIFLLGGKSEANIYSVEILRNKFNINICGHSPEFQLYPFTEEHNAKILEKISDVQPDIIFVGFGAFKQEMWISDNADFLKRNNVKLAVGSGGTFEFVAGIIKRAPRWMQIVGLEGVFRLLKEPKLFRLKRLLVSFGVFRYMFKKGVV